MLQALQDAGFDVFEIGDNLLWGGGAICVREAEHQEAARKVVEEFQENWRKEAREAPRASGVNLWLAIPIGLVLLIVILVNLLFVM